MAQDTIAPSAAPGTDLLSVDEPIPRVAASHVVRRSVLLPAAQLLYVPIPKTGWTSMLWALAPLGGLGPVDFQGSMKPEVSASMAVHDEAVWEARGLTLSATADPVRQEALSAPDWMRFAVVRDPTRRLWSAWQSKMLLREPVYFRMHADKEWYPRIPSHPGEVVEDFRAFVRALDEGFADEPRMRDPHWGRQTDVLDLVRLTHLGRIESLADTEQVVRGHLAARGLQLGSLPRENAMPLAYSPAVLDRPTAERIAELYAPDFERLGYRAPEPLTGPAAVTAGRVWAASAEPRLADMRVVVDRHARLHEVVTEHRRLQREARQQLRSLQHEARRTERSLQRRVDRTGDQLRDSRQQVRSLQARVAALEERRLRRRLVRLLAPAGRRLPEPVRSRLRQAVRG